MVEEDTWPMTVSKIRPHLYLTGHRGVTQANATALGITCIVNATIEMPCPAWVDTSQIQFIQIQLLDVQRSQLIDHFDRIATIIDQQKKANGKVLVHCMQGVSRSASLIISYLMKYEHMNLRDSYIYLLSCRPIVLPNSGFWEQLIQFERRQFQGKSSVMMMYRPSDLDDYVSPNHPFSMDRLYPDIVWEQLRKLVEDQILIDQPSVDESESSSTRPPSKKSPVSIEPQFQGSSDKSRRDNGEPLISSLAVKPCQSSNSQSLSEYCK